MKQVKLLFTIFLAALPTVFLLGALGCSAAGNTTSSLDATEASSTSVAPETSNSASPEPPSSSMPTEAATSSASTEATTSSTPAEAAPSSTPAEVAPSSTPAQMNPAGGMGGKDTMPGETTDKGYTATDTGIAINTTLNTAEAFTDRDLEQAPDTSSATKLTVASGQDVNISEEGIYLISGSANEATIVVEAPETAKVQLVLDGVSITNENFPAIYVKSADKVFVTLQGENTLEVTGEFVADGDTNTDGVIFSKDDLCLNGSGSLTINSSDHAIVGKDDLKVTGGTYTLNAANGSGLKANDSVRIASGAFTINAADGIKAKNDDDNELGYVYIKDGNFNITTTDNCIQGYAFVWIDGGTYTLNGEECIEGTYIQINGGNFDITANDDAINASIKSSVYTPTLEITGGTLNIEMAQGDTDALDSNGYIYIKGGSINISGQSAFDYAWGGEMTGGEVVVNGQQVTELTQSMGGGMGGMGGRGGRDMDFSGEFGGKGPREQATSAA